MSIHTRIPFVAQILSGGTTMTTKNNIGGLITSNNSVDANHDIDISSGYARDDGDAATMILASGITKQLDAVWAQGTNAGGLDVGSPSPLLLYAVWLIQRSSDNNVDVLFSLSFTAPTLPSGYDRKRLIAAISTDNFSNVVPYLQLDNYFRFLSPLLDIADNSLTDITAESDSLRVPPNCVAHIYGYLNRQTGGPVGIMTLYIRTNGAQEVLTDRAEAWMVSTANDNEDLGKEGWVAVDSNSEVEFATEEAANRAITIHTKGFIMTSRVNPS